MKGTETSRPMKEKKLKRKSCI